MGRAFEETASAEAGDRLDDAGRRLRRAGDFVRKHGPGLARRAREALAERAAEAADRAAEASDLAAGAAGPAVQAVQRLGGQARRQAERALASPEVEDALERLEAGLEEARELAAEQLETTRLLLAAGVRERPAAAVAVALGLGFVLGLVVTGRRR